MLHPPFARTAALPPAVREAGADTGSRHSLQTVYRKTVQRCYTLVVGKYLQTDRPAGRSARARAEGEPFMELRSNIKMLNYARKYLLNDTDNILPFPVRPQKPPRTGRLPTLLPRSAPRDEGVPAAALDTLYRSLSGAECGTHACIVLRHGRVVSEGWYAPYSSRYWHVAHSMCKSVTGTAIGMLADEGRLSLDEHVCEIFPEKCGLLTSRRMRAVTVRHLVTMTSGVAFKEAGAVLEGDWVKGFLDADVLFEPGSAFDYNSMNSYMLSAIVKRKTGLGLSAYLRPRLFEPLGFGDVAWETCPQGIEKGGWGMYVYLEDIAKLGQLYLQKGKWTGADGKEQRLLSAAWVEAAVKPDTVHENGEEYGYQLWPHSADHTYMFNGMFGQYVVVAPDLDLVLAVNAGAGNLFTRSRSYTAVREFLKAVARAPAPLPADPSADARLAFTAAHLRFGEAVPEPPVPVRHPWYARVRNALFPPAAPSAPSPIPDSVRPALAQTYRLEENRAGLLPAILGCMEDWYTKGSEKAAFRVGDNTLSLLWTEGGVEYCIPVGFENALEYELDLGGNRFAVGVTGRFTANEDDEPVLKVTLCFLESSSSRLLKFVFRPDGGLTVKFDEAPGLLVAMRSLQGTMKSQSQGLDLFKDIDYLHYLIHRVCSPVVHSVPPEELPAPGQA